MVHIDCCCFRAVYDEYRCRSQAMRVLCPRPDDLLPAMQGQVLQSTEGEVLQEPLQQRLQQGLWKQLRQSLRQRLWKQLCSVLCGSRRLCSELCRSGRLWSRCCSELCRSRCLRSGLCSFLCRSGDLRFGLQQRLQLGLWQVMLPQAEVLQGSQVQEDQVLQEQLQPWLRQQLRQQLRKQLCSDLCRSRELRCSRELCRSGHGSRRCSRSGSRCLVLRVCHQDMATATCVS